MTQYIRFELADRKPKTNVYHIVNREDTVLGKIFWYGAWRQYVFEPKYDPDETTIWSKGCLQQVTEFLRKLMEERKKSK